MTDYLDFTPDALREVAETILEAGGSSREEAVVVAEHLVLANLSGHDSHGIGMIPAYVRNLRKGLVVPNREPELVSDGGAVLVFDGLRGYGQAVGRRAMEAAIERSSTHGVVLMTLRNAHHLGRIGTYGEQAVASHRVSMHFVNVADHDPYVAPFRGAEARFATNPICLALPGTGSQPPLVLDMATSRIAAGKVRVAYNEGVPVPAGSLIDAEGRPTDDPAALYGGGGALLPFGEHKGYGLALFAELFGGMLSGGGTIQPGNPRGGSIVNCMLTVVFDPDRLVERDWMARELEAYVAYCKSARAADPDLPVLVPGDPERAARSQRASSIPVDAESWEQILKAAESLGLERSRLAPG
ncbi:MAG: malate/lactate/ureidoglycolate dehydrogenase [Thermoanaerobaculia bacterium]|nr:malate/lactate/ureidoglycolate dehydrogenase [Thermoanaerobaculia bacterium]